MAGSKTLSIKYTADASGVLRAQASIEKSAASLSTRMQNLGKSLARTGRLMTTGLTLPIVAGFKVAIDEATQFNQVQAQTEAALKSTGSAANVTAGHITALSTKLGKLQAVDGEVVHSMENILLTFPAVRNEVGKGNKIFDRASLAISNVSARMGEDLNSAAVQVGKALSDPIRGMTALRRIGVAFSDDQVKLITHLQNTGRTMAAQKIILGELNKEFGGSAKAAGEAASPLTKLNLVFREFAQKIGPTVIKMVEGLTKFIEKLVAWFERLSPGVQKAVVVALALVAVLGPILIIIGAVIAAINLWTIAIAAVIAIVVLLILNWQKVKSVTQTVWNAIEHAIGKALAFITRALAAWIAFVLGVFSAILHGAAAAFGWIPGVGGKLKAARDAFDRFTNRVVGGLRQQADAFASWGSQAARHTAAVNEQMRKLNATLLDVARHSHIHIVIDQSGALHGGIEHRQHGGPVKAWHPYMVGEAGAELFVPSHSGRIVPHGKASSEGAGTTVIVNVQGSVVTERELVEVVRKGLIKVGARNGGRTGL